MESVLCTIAECAALLHVSADTIEREIRRGIIPVKRIRNTVRISRAWLESYAAESHPILLTRRQVSRKLAVSCESVRTLQRKGLLSTVIIGKQQRIPALSVSEYVKRNSFAFLRTRSGAKSAPLPSRAAVASPGAVCGTRFSNVRGV